PRALRSHGNATAKARAVLSPGPFCCRKCSRDTPRARSGAPRPGPFALRTAVARMEGDLHVGSAGAIWSGLMVALILRNPLRITGIEANGREERLAGRRGGQDGSRHKDATQDQEA